MPPPNAHSSNPLTAIGSTLKRAGQIGRIAYTMNKVRRSHDDHTRQVAQRALTSLLANARGVPMKIGQWLASTHQGSAFKPLTETIEPRPLEEMLPALTQAFDQPLETIFKEIAPSHAAASLGQVHRAELLDGTIVAVKIQYPDIACAVDSEMKLLGLMPNIGPGKKWGFDLDSYKQALKTNMDRELDYLNEAKRQQHFADQVQLPNLIIPTVYLEWCRPTVLVQSWHEGVSLDEAAHWSIADRRSLCQTLGQMVFQSLFKAGQLHGDPHQGNFMFTRATDGTPQVVLIDFGCTVEISKQSRTSLLKLIADCRENRPTDPMAGFAAMGFDADKLTSISHALAPMCHMLFEPFLTNEPFALQRWDLSDRINMLLGDMRWWFRSAGPPEMIFLMRAFSGLVEQLRTLKVIVPWWPLLEEAIGTATIDAARAYRFPEPITTTPLETRTFNDMAKHLKIEVTQHGAQVVNIAMPAEQVFQLDTLIPDDVKTKMTANAIVLDPILDQVRAQGLCPQSLFELDADDRVYRVFLQ